MALLFGNTDLTTGYKAVWSYVPGVVSRKLETVHLARAQGEMVKDLGIVGADHALQITYINVPSASLAKLMGKIETLSASAPVVSTVTVDTVATVPNCVVSSVKPGKPEIRALVTSSGYSSGDYYDLVVDITFRQLRA